MNEESRVGVLFIVGGLVALFGLWFLWQGTLGWVRVKLGREPLSKGCAVILGLAGLAVGGALLYLGFNTSWVR